MTPEELKRIDDDAYDQRLLAIFLHVTASGTATPADTQKLFNVYNERFDPKESGYTCGMCVRRVVDNTKAHLVAKGLV